MKNHFLITGAQRSGTSSLSCLINSQKKSFCFEHGLSKLSDIKNSQDLNFFNSNFEATLLNHPSVNIKVINKYPIKKDKLILRILNNIGDYYKINNVGFKETLLSKKEIQYFINLNFKVIIIKRNLNNQLKSHLNRIEKNKYNSLYSIKDYLERIDYFQFNQKEKKKILILNFNDLKNKDSSIYKKISKFLNFKVTKPKKYYYNFSKNISYSKFFKNTSYTKKIRFIDININKEEIKKYNIFLKQNSYFNLLYLKYLFIKKINKKYLILIMLALSILLNLLFFTQNI